MRKYNISRLQQFQSCEQKFKWKYLDNLEPRFDGVPKPLGTAFHLGVAEMYRGATRTVAKGMALVEFHRVLPPGWAGGDDKTVQQIKKGEIQLMAMMDAYPWATEAPENVVAVEKDMEWEVEKGKTLVFRVDRLIRVNGGLWLHDTKTTGIELSAAVKSQRLRTQYAGYAAGVEAVMGEKLAGVMLDMVHKPEVYFKKTGEFSSMKEAGFLREPVAKTEEQLGEFKAWFTVLAGSVEASITNQVWLKNTDTCMAFNRTCPYLELCLRPEWNEGMKGLFATRPRDYADAEEVGDE